MSAQTDAVKSAALTVETTAATSGEKVTHPVNWDPLHAEFSPSPEVAEAVKQVFKDDAEILRQLA
jgi:hypothetical protein